MYIDAKRIAIIAISSILALYLWWATASRNSRTVDQIEELEFGASSNPEKIAAQHQDYENTVDEARSLMREGQLRQASLLLYHAYRDFESYLNYQGHTEIAPNLTLRQWHDQLASELGAEWENAYEVGKLKLISGDYSRREFSTILNNVPFPYIRKTKTKWDADQSEIERARIANAPNWVVVTIWGTMAGSADFEEKVQAALLDKWPSDSKLKLVFGGTMSRGEKAVAARVLNISIKGDEVSYRFVGNDDNFGSRSFSENLVANFEIQNKSDTLASTSWDDIPEITAHHKAPESLTATFDRFDKKQQADFSKILDEQKQGLLDEFENQLAAIPVFAK